MIVYAMGIVGLVALIAAWIMFFNAMQGDDIDRPPRR